MAKYVIMVGGVFSGTGKGISCASLALLMKMRGLKVGISKFDPYLNTSASVLSPREHGENFVCNDGTETDLDLGSYERLTGIEVSAKNIFTGGTLYKELIAEQEEGKYLGQTVQVTLQAAEKIKQRLLMVGTDCDIAFVEIGGTVGDMESAPFLEAIRQFKQQHFSDVMIAMVAPILWVPTIEEFKTKPLQNSVKTLQSCGLQPDLLICRTDQSLPKVLLDKVANLTNVNRTSVFEGPDVSSIYQVPIEFWKRHIDDLICDRFHFERNGVKIHKYKDLVDSYISADDLPSIEIGIVNKYANSEAYLSLREALYHAGLANKVRVKKRWINAEELEGVKDNRGLKKYFEGLSGLIIPGGFDVRGVEGKIKAIRYCREKQLPFLGICLGLQCAVIEFARNVCKLENANSLEFDPKTDYPVIHFVEGQENLKKKSGTLRLGSYPCELTKDSLAYEIYKKKTIDERHRHRYEVNPFYREQFEAEGFRVSGVHPQTGLIEIVELDKCKHPFYIGTQAHPEFKSRLGSPAPLFDGLVAAGVKYSDSLAKKSPSNVETTVE